MRERHVEIKPIQPMNPFQPQPEAPFYAHYIRTHDRIPSNIDEISLHQAIVAFYSDFTLMTTALRPHGLSWISQIYNVLLIIRFISIVLCVQMIGCCMTWRQRLVQVHVA
jgi:acyl-CoA thioesterase